jgi:polysaccharide biosynthesis protein PslH
MRRAGHGLRCRVMAPRDLLVTTYTPQLENGRALRTYAIVRALAAAGPLDVAFVPHGGPEPSPEYRALPGVAFHRIEPSRGLRRGSAFAAQLARGVPPSIARACSPELLAGARALAAAPGRGRVIASDFQTMTTLLPLAAERAVVYSAQNIESSYSPENGRSRLEHHAWRRLERRLLEAATEAWMVSERDLELARRLAPGTPLRYVPNVVDTAAIVPREAPAGGAEALMLADFTYGPNLEGLRWLVAEVLPRVWAQRPEVRLRVVGRGLPNEAWDPRLVRLGFVDALADAYDGVAAVVVPLREGGGSPMKLVEALAYGVPIVATPVATRGLAVRDGEHVREAANPEAFAAALLALLQGGDATMAARARGLAEREYSIARLAQLVGAAPPA